jgi:hypothetical protein
MTCFPISASSVMSVSKPETLTAVCKGGGTAGVVRRGGVTGGGCCRKMVESAHPIIHSRAVATIMAFEMRVICPNSCADFGLLRGSSARKPWYALCQDAKQYFFCLERAPKKRSKMRILAQCAAG